MALHRFTIFTAVIALAVIVMGVLVSGALPSSDAAAVTLKNGNQAIALGHQHAGTSLAVLALILAIWATARDSRKGMRILAWTIFGLLAIQVALGFNGYSSATLHALLAQVIFALLCAAVVVTSRSWMRGPELAKDSGWPSMRSLAVVTTALAFLQVALGAGFRYGDLGLLWHISGAILVALMNLFIGVCAVQHYAAHPTIKPAGVAMLIITCTQVMLGMVVISIGGSKLLANSPAALVAAVVHVATGALTLGSTLVLAIQVRRNLFPKAVLEAQPRPAA